MPVGGKGGIGGLWDGFKSGVSKAINYLSFLPSGTPVIGGAAIASKVIVKGAEKLNIPLPLYDDDVNDIDENDNTVTSSIQRIMNRKVFGVPIVPLVIGGVVLSFIFKGKR